MPDDLSKTIPPVTPPAPPEPPSTISPPLANDVPLPPLPPLNPPTDSSTVPPTPELPNDTPPAADPKKIKIGLAVLILFLISVSVPMAVWLTQQRQEIRKEAQGQICCRVLAKNLCGDANGWDEVFTAATRAECDAYAQNPPAFSYSCNCNEYCHTGPGCISPDVNTCSGHDANQICSSAASGDKQCNVLCGKSRCSTSNPNDFRVEDIPCESPTITPPVATPTPTTTTVGCYKQCTPGTTVCGAGLACEDSNEGAGVPFYLCLNHSCPGSPTCTCGGPTATPQPTATPTTTPNPSGTPQPTPTPTQPGYTVSCLTCKAYDANWNQITPANIQLGQTVYFVTRGSTGHPSSIDRARFRINIGGNTGAWRETPNQHVIAGNYFYYIQYTVASSGSYTVESMVHNSVLGWF